MEIGNCQCTISFIRFSSINGDEKRIFALFLIFKLGKKFEIQTFVFYFKHFRT